MMVLKQHVRNFCFFSEGLQTDMIFWMKVHEMKTTQGRSNNVSESTSLSLARDVSILPAKLLE